MTSLSQCFGRICGEQRVGVRRTTALAMLVAAVAGAGALAGADRAAAAAPDVVVTSKPIHSLVAAVMGANGQPKLLVDGAASPHTYALKPSDAKAVNKARLFFRVSEGLEPFTGKLVKSLPKSVEVVSLVEAPGLKLLGRREGDTFEVHDHGHGKKGHDHGHRHDDRASAGEGDPHVWLDPDNAAAMVDAIAARLSAADAANAATYKANAEATKGRIAALAGEIEADVAALKDRPFVVFHDAYQYFERRFGLEAAGSITLSPEQQPSARRLSAIRAKIGKLGAVCVFAEPQFKSKLVDTVIEGTKARRGTLDPEGALLDAGPDLYPALMRGLAKGLKECLAGTT